MEQSKVIKVGDRLNSSVIDNADHNDEKEVDSITSISCPDKLYKNDENHLLQIFPSEVWSIVLNHRVNFTVDQQNYTNSSPYFRELLLTQRTVFLFPMVLEILVPRNQTHKYGEVKVNTSISIECNFTESDEDDEEDDDDDEKKYGDWELAFFECRLVCHVWNKAVENCYKKIVMAALPGFESETDQFSYEAWTMDNFTFNEDEDIHKFLKLFKKDHSSGMEAPKKNPFIGKYICFEVRRLYDWNSFQPDPTYLRGMSEIVSLFGHHICFCDMILSHLFQNTTEIYLILREWLNGMPHLKYLRLTGFSQVGNMSLDSFVTSSLPKLKRLETLELDSLAGPVANELIQRNNHVSFLLMKSIEGVRQDVYCSMTNLTKIETTYQMLESFGQERSSHWKLTELLLSRQFPNPTPFNTSTIFLMLETNWKDTLTVLDLSNPFDDDDPEVKLHNSWNLRLNLSRLRRLNLRISGAFFLNFILPLENSLEYLFIDFDYPIGYGIERETESVVTKYKKVKKEQIIEFAGFEMKLQESNIWGFFEKLETVKLEYCPNSLVRKLLYKRDRSKFTFMRLNT